MPFEVYASRVRTERGEEAVNAWLETHLANRQVVGVDGHVLSLKAAQELRQQADTLAEVVGVFKLATHASHAPRPMAMLTAA